VVSKVANNILVENLYAYYIGTRNRVINSNRYMEIIEN